MATEPTFDQTLTTDGITVRLHRVGEKLTVELTDPAGALRQLHVQDTVTGTTLAALNDLGTRTRTSSILDAMYLALEDLDEKTINAVLAGMTAGPIAGWEAKEFAWGAYLGSEATEGWGEIFGALGKVAQRRGIDAINGLVPPFLAASHRHLIGAHGFTQDHYDAMTTSWRVLVGPIHPGDADLTSPVTTVAESMDRVPIWTFATAEIAVDPARIDLLIASRPFVHDIRYTVARHRGENLVKLLHREPAWRQVAALVSRTLQIRDRFRQYEVVSVLNDVALGLLLRDQIGTDAEFSQADYDALTSAWRMTIGPIHPQDADLLPPGT